MEFMEVLCTQTSKNKFIEIKLLTEKLYKTSLTMGVPVSWPTLLNGHTGNG